MAFVVEMRNWTSKSEVGRGLRKVRAKLVQKGRRAVSKLAAPFSVSFARDLMSLGRYRARPADFLFYCHRPLNAEWIRTTFHRLKAEGHSVALVVSHGAGHIDGFEPEEQFFCDNFQILLRYYQCRAMVSASAGVGRAWAPRGCTKVHVPHSLVSLHMIYPPGALDGYDCVFACGEHHCREVAAMRDRYPSFVATATPVGYGKSELLAAERRPQAVRPLVVIAPSWGRDNLLEATGVDLVTTLLELDVDVIVRPHPRFFYIEHPLIEEMEHRFRHTERFRLESSLRQGNSIMDADVLVSDYSGAAYEYAFCNLRPVVFVDVPTKIGNPNWKQLGLPPMELELRTAVGTLVPAEVISIRRAVASFLDARGSKEWAERIRAIRARYEFNHGEFSLHASRALVRLLEGKTCAELETGDMTGDAKC